MKTILKVGIGVISLAAIATGVVIYRKKSKSAGLVQASEVNQDDQSGNTNSGTNSTSQVGTGSAASAQSLAPGTSTVVPTKYGNGVVNPANVPSGSSAGTWPTAPKVYNEIKNIPIKANTILAHSKIVYLKIDPINRIKKEDIKIGTDVVVSSAGNFNRTYRLVALNFTNGINDSMVVETKDGSSISLPSIFGFAQSGTATIKNN